MTGRGQDMAVVAKPVTNSRWCLAFHGPDTFTDDLGSLGAWVGPRTGPDRRDHGEKEDYVLRRLLVAWREAGGLRFPFEISAAIDDKGEPDFVLAWPDGDSLGVEVTEAGEEDYQAWLTGTEREREEGTGDVSVPHDASTPRTAAAIRKAIVAKVRKFNKGWYRGPSACDLVVYDNTAWGGFLDIEEVIAAIDRRDELVGQFRQIDLVAGPFVFLDLFGDNERVDVGQTYEIDYANWIFNQVERMRHGSTDELDFALIAEELESLGKSERRALASHLRNLFLHFLKWQFQPGRRRGQSWRLSIDNARSEIFELLTEMPSLRRELDERIASEYGRARRTAAIETELDLATFPEECPYSREQIVDPEFYPGDEA